MRHVAKYAVARHSITETDGSRPCQTEQIGRASKDLQCHKQETGKFWTWLHCMIVLAIVVWAGAIMGCRYMIQHL